MTIGEQHLSIYGVLIHKLEQFIQALNFWVEHISSVTWMLLFHMIDKVNAALPKANLDYTLCFLICIITMT